MSDPTTEEMPWKLPVFAAILGAFMTAIYVILTIVNAPTEDPDAPSSGIAVESSSLPTGYSAVGSDIGMRADVLRPDSEGTTAFVSSVVNDGVNRAAIDPVEVATWELSAAGGRATMMGQSTSAATPGAVTILFPSAAEGREGSLSATLPGQVEDADDLLTMSATLPTVVADHRIAFDDHVVVVDELVIDEHGGWMRWHLESGVAAKVEAVVSVEASVFATSGYGSNPRPPWGQHGATQLSTVGGARSESESPVNITVEMYVSVVTSPGESFEIPIGSVVGP